MTSSSSKPQPLDPQSNRSINLGRYLLIQKIVHGGITVYMLLFIYRNLHVNGVDYSGYIKPITDIIPFWPFFLASLFVEYIIENLRKNTAINADKMEKDFINTTANILAQNPAKLVWKYFWNSLKTMVKYMFLSILLAIPIMLIISIIQVIFTGSKVPVTMNY